MDDVDVVKGNVLEVLEVFDSVEIEVETGTVDETIFEVFVTVVIEVLVSVVVFPIVVIKVVGIVVFGNVVNEVVVGIVVRGKGSELHIFS